MAAQERYMHKKLIIKCQIDSPELDKTEATINNERNPDKLLSNITREFPFLKKIKSQWNFCINSQCIDPNNSQFQTILSTIPPTATVGIVWKTRKQPVQKSFTVPMEDSGKVISLGHRLKSVAECITNKQLEQKEASEYVEGDDEETKFESELEFLLKHLKEIALVEGYNESSHVMTTLDNICKLITNNDPNNNDLKSALQKINGIIREVMPFDYKEFFQLDTKTRATADLIEKKVCWVLLGPTGAGKSTSIHFFCGSQFKKDGHSGSVIIDGQDGVASLLKDKSIHIGEQVTESKTRFIEAVDLDLRKYENDIDFDCDEPQQVLWVDSPGFEDTAGPEVNIANGIGTIRALKKAKAVKVIITFKEAHLDYRCKIIRNIANNMGNAISNLQQQLNTKKTYDSPIAGFLTKSKIGITGAKEIFMKAFNEQKDKNENLEENALFRSLVYKLGKKGPVYDINIDLENNENNEKERLKIIKSLVEDTGYITCPNEIFSEFISPSALLQLKGQIEKNYSTIGIILDNDKYFENPKYIQHIIDILDNIAELKGIIKKAGGKYFESRLKDCVNTFVTKWNEKIEKGNNILSNINIKECSVGSLKRKMKEFHRIKYIMKTNINVIKRSKYYKQYKFNDINCLDDGLHECCDEVYEIIMNYLQNIKNQLKSDDSDIETDYDIKSDHDDAKSSVENMELESIDNDSINTIGYMDDDDNFKIIKLSVEKCYVLYKETRQYKDDYIKKKVVKKLQKSVDEIIKYLNKKLYDFMDSTKKSQNIDGISRLMFMFSNLSKIHNISKIMDKYLNNNNNNNKMPDLPSNIPDISREITDNLEDDLDCNKSYKIEKIIQTTANKLKENICKSIKYICNSYSLNVMEVSMHNIDDNDEKNNDKTDYVNVDAILKSNVYVEIRSRENRLVSFCLWIKTVIDTLRDRNLKEIKDLESWLKNIKTKWINWLGGAVVVELKKCNDLLINGGAKTWKDVDKLLAECESLRQDVDIATNTSQEYFKTKSEYDSSKTALANKAAIVLDKLNTGENINYDEIIEIANQLYNAGCSTESSEMKQIYQRLKQHVNNLKTKTEDISLSIQMHDDLTVIQNTMKELNTMKEFEFAMPDIKQNATECYQVLNVKVLKVLEEIEIKYNLDKYSTETSKTLRDKLKIYEKIKSKVDKNILTNVIEKCELKTLTELINDNEDKINELQNKNKSIDRIIKDKSGTLMEDIKKYEKLTKSGKTINKKIVNDDLDEDDLKEWLDEVGHKSVKEIRDKLKELKEQSKQICLKEQEDKENNLNKINELNRINNAVQKCVKAENSLMLLKPDKVVQYRTDNDMLTNSITELDNLLAKNQDHIFTKTLSLSDAYNALTFLNKCTKIRWKEKKNLNNKIEDEKDDKNKKVLSNTEKCYRIKKNVTEYLRAYGYVLESKLADLIGKLKVSDAKCDLNDENYVNDIKKAIKDLSECLREFREISNFDRQIAIEIQMEEDIYDDNDNKKKRKQLKLVLCLFANPQIQFNIDNYINNCISDHKSDIIINLDQWRIQKPDKLPLLHFVCLSMSALDRFTSNKDEQASYYRLASKVDGELTKFGNDQTKQIMPLFEAGAFDALKEILISLQETADAKKDGIAQKVYRDAVMRLSGALNKLMNETQSKLVIEINKNNNIDLEKILSLNKNLKNVKSLVETIYDHLRKSEQKKVKNEEKELAVLLTNRLKQLMKAAVISAKKGEFKQCETRLDNISRLMEHNITSQFYIDEKKEENDGNDGYVNKIVSEYNKIQQEIADVMEDVVDKVDKANKALKNTNSFNPYYCLRLTTLHSQLAGSQDERFRGLWTKIYKAIVNAIQNILFEVKRRNNQMINQTEYNIENKSNQVMTYGEQQAHFRKIEMSLALFPTEMKEMVQTILKDAKDCAQGGKTIVEDGFKQFVTQKSWDDVARNLIDFEQTDPKLSQTSRQAVVTEISKEYKEPFDENMKTLKGFTENIDKLGSYKSIGRSFTKIKYYDDNNNDDVINNNVIAIPHVKSTLEQMYKEIENQFMVKFRDVCSSLNGHKAYKYLKDGFLIIIKVLENKNNLPQRFAENIMNECRKLYKPIQKLINKLKTRKYKGLDKTNNDVDPLIDTLNELKELNDVDFHSSVRKFLNIPDMDEKENILKLEKDIDIIEYDNTVNETKEMLTEFKETISKEGLNKNIIQKNQFKRLQHLKDLSAKCKALKKSSNICGKHLEMKQDEFNKSFIEPCTKRMEKDVKQMEKETKDAFTKKRLDINDLQKANANLEAFYAVKSVFEKEISDDLCNEIKIDEAIEDCEKTATQRVKQLSDQIQMNGKELKEDDTDKYLEQCAQNLISLEYLNQHINFKTSINENSNQSISHEENELHQEIQEAIENSMDFLTNNKKTKSKINSLHSRLIRVDANYGSVFTEQHSAFMAERQKAMNQKFRELDINAIIDNLKQTEKDMQSQLDFNELIGIDYDKIRDTFNKIVHKYNELINKHLTQTTSFEELTDESLPGIANDAQCVARKAIGSKISSLNQIYNSGMNFIKGSLSWFTDQQLGQSNKSNPRDCYWTPNMRNVVPDLIAYVLAVWTLSTASGYHDSVKDQKGGLKKARNAQIIAILSILCLDIDSIDKKNKLINNLVEVGTGEGKSVIMAVTAIVLALLDFDVYCACYSELLSNRDQNAFNDLFMLFGVQNNIQYQTFNNILEQMINDGGDIRDICKKIVLDEKIDETDDYKEPAQNWLNNKQKILFIDEVDKFFSTDFFGKQYRPSCVIPNNEMKNLIDFVWKEYLSNNSKWSVITKQKIEQSDEYNALLAAFNEEWHDLLNESIKDIIDGIRTFKDDSYKIENGRDISYKFSDSYSTKLFYGYRTLFTYLYEFENGNITDKEYVDDKLTWFLKCGSFSYSEIPNDFYAILGVTGTLKSLSKKEHQVIQGSYGIKKYIVMPSLFDKHGKLDYAQNKHINVIKSNYYFNEVHGTITNSLVNDIDTIDRPLLIFFKDENTLNYFYNLGCCDTWRTNKRIQLLTPDLNEKEKKLRILNATKPNCITFATEEYGRGIDFKVFDKQLDRKGMHVELTYWPHTLAEEIQIKGRTARQGNQGSFHIILNEDEIKDQCKVSTQDIEKHRKDGDLYGWLNKIRNKVFEKQYDEASHYVKELKPIHQQSQQLAMSLRNKNIKIAKEKLLLFNKGANIQSAAKLSILIDSTGSMSSCLGQCKTVIQKTIPQLVEFLKDNNINTESFEIQIIGYRNYNARADEILEFSAFTSDQNELTKFIHSLKASYGWGDEAVEIAFHQLNKQEKKPNIVMLMADAKAQTKEDIKYKREDQYGEKYWEDAREGIFKNILDWNEELTKFMNENNDTSVFCFYLENDTKDNFDQIANIGNGRSMYLNINNETESIKLLQAALSETILLKINNGSMEYVEKFREQNKNMPQFL